MEIARSTCSNGLVWRETWAEYCFVGSQNTGISLENATTTPSHGSGHAMELRLQLDAATHVPECMVCGKGMALKPAPCTAVVFLEAGIGGESLIGSVTRESFFPLVP